MSDSSSDSDDSTCEVVLQKATVSPLTQQYGMQSKFVFKNCMPMLSMSKHLGGDQRGVDSNYLHKYNKYM